MNPTLHTHFETVVPYTENPDRSVLCIGHISRERFNDLAFSLELGLIYRRLAAQGYDTYIHTSWDRFSILSALELQEDKVEMVREYGLPYVFSMGIFEASRPMEPTPPYYDFFDEVIWPQADDDELTTEEVFDTVLNSVAAVVFDNKDDDPFVRTILDKAKSLNKRMIDVNFSAL